MNIRCLLGFLVACSLGQAFPAAAEPGVTDQTIRIGQSITLTGSRANLGLQLRAGSMVYFDSVNKKGGVNGRRIELISLDDAYEPEKAAANTKRLVENENVLALFGYRGAETTMAASKVFTPAGVPLIATFTGVNTLRTPFNRMIFHVRAAYATEVERIIELQTMVGVRNFAVFYQNDSFGKELKAVAEASTKQQGAKILAYGAVDALNTDVTPAVEAIAKTSPDLILMFCGSKQGAEFIKKMKQKGVQTSYASVSIIGGDSLYKELKEDARGVIVSQVVPLPTSDSVPIVREYRTAVKAQTGKEDYSLAGLEGYIAAKVLVEGLRRAGPAPTREKLISALEGLGRYDMGGVEVNYSPTSHLGSRFVDLTIVGRAGQILH